MKVKIDFFRGITKEIEGRINNLASLLDNFDITADEKEIADLAEMLRYYDDLVESTPIA